MSIERKNLNMRLFLWVAFATASLLTFLVRYSPLFYVGFQLKLLNVLGILCVILAAMILVREGFRPWPITGVLLGLVVGQLWFIEGIAMILFWKFSGFAP